MPCSWPGHLAPPQTLVAAAEGGPWVRLTLQAGRSRLGSSRGEHTALATPGGLQCCLPLAPSRSHLSFGGGWPSATLSCPTLLRTQRPLSDLPSGARLSPQPQGPWRTGGRARVPGARPPLGAGGPVGIPGEGKPPLQLPASRVLHALGAPLGAGRRGGDVIPGGAEPSEPG